MAAVAEAFVSVRPDLKGFGGELKSGIGGMTKVGAAAAAGLGAAIGAVFVNEFGDAMERQRLGSRLAAQLDLTGPEAQEAGRIAGDLFANAYGDSLDQVHDAVGTVMSSLGDLDSREVEDLTAKALDLSAAFGVETAESVGTLGVLMRTGLARDAEEGFDLVTAAMQQVPAQMRGELLPILEEYSQDFAGLGFTGSEAFGLLIEAASAGRYELDKTGDVMKELTIRATDMSTGSQEAYETLGLNAEEMSSKILQGGETAREGFGQIIDGLLGIEDPALLANTAIALMGTPLEDLSVTEIPTFLQRLQDMDGDLGQVEGSAVRMGQTLNDNVATDFESFKRKAGSALDGFLAEHVLPDAAKIIEAFEEDGVGGALDKAVDLWTAAQPKVDRWFNRTFVPWWEGTAVPWMGYLGAEMGTALLEGLAETLTNSIDSLIENIVGDLPFDISDAVTGGKGAQLNFDNPVARPKTKSRSVPLSRTLTKFHDGGFAVRGGIAELAAKERVLDPRQTAAFEDLVRLLGGSSLPTRDFADVRAPAVSAPQTVIHLTVQGSLIHERELDGLVGRHMQRFDRRNGRAGNRLGG